MGEKTSQGLIARLSLFLSQFCCVLMWGHASPDSLMSNSQAVLFFSLLQLYIEHAFVLVKIGSPICWMMFKLMFSYFFFLLLAFIEFLLITGIRVSHDE